MSSSVINKTLPPGVASLPRPSGHRNGLVVWIVAPVLALAMLVILGVVIASVGIGWMGYEPYSVEGHSMEPTISPGSLALTRESDPRDIGSGDIVVFDAVWADTQGTSKMVIHRITALTPVAGGFLGNTRGDGNSYPDPGPTLFSEKTPVVVAVLPYVGYLFNLYEDWGTQILVLILAAAVMLLLYLTGSPVAFFQPHAPSPRALKLGHQNIP